MKLAPTTSAEAIDRSRKYYYENREKCLKQNSERRHNNRYRNRIIARAHAELLTDRYIREQLSKYSEKSMWEWGEEDVIAKRNQIIKSRERRITDEKAATIRLKYNTDPKSTIYSLGKEFGVHPSSVHQILKNIIHIDPSFVLKRRIKRYSEVKMFFQMTHAASEISKISDTK